MSKAKRAEPGRIINRRAKFDYELGDSFVVGLQLSGGETKALRLGHGQLAGSYVNVKDGELWLVGAQINSSKGIYLSEDDQIRSRKLLAHQKEIDELIAARAQGKTIVPLEFLTRGRFVKLRIATGKGKRRYDKRETLKRRQQERDIARQTKS